MSENVCQNCDREERKKRGYLCEKIATEDGLPARCIHPESVVKLNVLNYYLEIFCVAMKKTFENRYFVDLFSGPGACYEKKSGKFHSGSPLIALNLKPPFTDYIFVDLDRKTSEILKKRCQSQLGDIFETIRFLNFDSNKNVDAILEHLEILKSISVILIDPNGLDIEYETVKKLAYCNSIDLIINFSIFDLKRNEVNYRKEGSKADKFFGTPEWRNVGPRYWLNLYKKQLGKLGFVGIETSNEHHITIRTPTGAPIYHLIYASKNKLGLKFWRAAKKRFSKPDILDQRY